jgi:hypothetical protein
MTAGLAQCGIDEDAVDPTIPAPMTNVAEYGFEGRFEDWAEDARYFEYSKAANPIGSGHTSKIPIRAFSRELYSDGPTQIIPLDLSHELGIANGPDRPPESPHWQAPKRFGSSSPGNRQAG